MKQLNLKVWFAILALLAALVVAWKVLEPEEAVDAAATPPPSRRSNEKPTANRDSSVPDRFPPLRNSDRSQGASFDRSEVASFGARFRALQLNQSHAKYLDWSLDELESYLEEKAASLTPPEMFVLLDRLLLSPMSNLEMNQLRPGSISLADQARLGLKYTDQEHHQELINKLWMNNRDSPDCNFFAEVISQIEPGHLRSEFVRRSVSYHFSDYGRMVVLLASADPLKEISPSFVPVHDDEREIIVGLSNALKRITQKKQADKAELIELVSNSNIEKNVQSGMIEFVNTWAR